MRFLTTVKFETSRTNCNFFGRWANLYYAITYITFLQYLPNNRFSYIEVFKTHRFTTVLKIRDESLP